MSDVKRGVFEESDLRVAGACPKCEACADFMLPMNGPPPEWKFEGWFKCKTCGVEKQHLPN